MGDIFSRSYLNPYHSAKGAILPNMIFHKLF